MIVVFLNLILKCHVEYQTTGQKTVKFSLYHAVGHSKVPKERLQKEFVLKCKVGG